VAKDVIMPVLGMNQDTAVLLSWLKHEGEQVVEGEPIMEVETDKATMELDAPASGTLARVTAAAGDEVRVGSVIAVILGEGEAAEAAPGPAGGVQGNAQDNAQDNAATARRPPAQAPTPAPVLGNGDASRAPMNGAARSAAPAARAPEPVAMGAPGPYRLTPASPKARRLAAEHGLDVAVLVGSGPENAVLAADVLRAAERRDRAGAVPGEALSPSAPSLAFVREVDATPLLEVIAWTTRRAGARGHAAGLDVGDLLARFLGAVWARQPLKRSGAAGPGGLRYRRVADGAVHEVHLDDPGSTPLSAIVAARSEAAATAAPHAGGPAALALLDLTRAHADLAGDAPTREGLVSLVAGRIEDRVVAVDGAPAVRATLTLRLAFDPAAVDLAAAAAWSDRLLALVEDPSALALLYA
jgi:pyruvate dehydrogenase E2 component (dihydrolipoamide acetyltransferase)